MISSFTNIARSHLRRYRHPSFTWQAATTSGGRVRSLHDDQNASTLLISDPILSPTDSLPDSTLNTLGAAARIHRGDITLMIPVETGVVTMDSPVVEEARVLNPAIKKVVLANIGDGSGSPSASPLLAENVAECVRSIQHEIGPYSHLVACANKHSSNYMSRAGALLCIAPVTDIIKIDDFQTYIRPMYAGNAISKVRSSNIVNLLTFRQSGYEAAPKGGGDAEVSEFFVPATDLIEYVSASNESSGKVDLGSASVVVSGGRGVKSKENFEIIEALAEKLGGAVGASRAAVDSGYIANNYQVGQTGKVVSPDLYIAVGISGAIQHLSGMKDSKTIVAINKDKEAPIFQVADYGLVDDLFKAVPELTEKV